MMDLEIANDKDQTIALFDARMLINNPERWLNLNNREGATLNARIAFWLDRRWHMMLNDTYESKQHYIRYWCIEHYKNHGYIRMTVE